MQPSMEHYRFRAKFRVDVEILMSVLPDASYEIHPLDARHPDVEVDMVTKTYVNTFSADKDFSLN
jgi:hypothetical protein